MLRQIYSPAGWESIPISETESVNALRVVANEISSTGIDFPVLYFDGNGTLLAVGLSLEGVDLSQQTIQINSFGILMDLARVSVSEQNLTVQVTGEGRVESSPGGILCPGNCTASYPEWATVTLRAIPSGGYAFSSWGGDCAVCGDNATCEIRLYADLTCSASFSVIAPEVPDIAVSPASLDFSGIKVGGSASKTVLVRNEGRADLEITGISISGGNDFSLNHTCLERLSPGGNCTVTVTFSPGSVGSQNATLVIRSNDPDEGKIRIPLFGRAEAVSQTCTPDGDVAPLGNRDGKANIGDALVTLRFALELETPSDEDRCHADVVPLGENGRPNPDGKITIGDALVILRKALGLVDW